MTWHYITYIYIYIYLYLDKQTSDPNPSGFSNKLPVLTASVSFFAGQFFQQKPVQNCTPEKASQVHLFRWPNEFRRGILGIYTGNVSITYSCTQNGGTGRHKNHCGYAKQRSCAVSFRKWYWLSIPDVPVGHGDDVALEHSTHCIWGNEEGSSSFTGPQT